MWRAMSDTDKAPYMEKYKQDHIRYEKELKQFETQGYFIDKNGVDSRTMTPKIKIKRNFKNTPSQSQKPYFENQDIKPKKVSTDFMLFVKENAKLVIAEKGLKSAAEATKILGEQWRAMEDSTKEKYRQLKANDR